MTHTAPDNGADRERQGGPHCSGIAGIALSATGIFLGFPFLLILLPVMTMGAANCTDSSDELICNPELMNALAITSLAGLAMGFLLPLTLGAWQVRNRRGVSPTLITAWAIAAFPLLVFMGAGFSG